MPKDPLLLILLHLFICQTYSKSAIRNLPSFALGLSPLNLALIPAFYDTKSTGDRNQRTKMASNQDAEAYHSMISASVDFTDIYVRNGYVSATRSVRDIDTNSRRSFLYSIPLPPANSDSPPTILPPTELPTKIKARIQSQSGSKIAILVEENIPSIGGTPECKRNVFEIWADQGHRLANRIVLPSDKHGPVCTDFAWFGGINWSPDESTLVYCAEINNPKTESFFGSSTTDDNGKIMTGEQFTLGVGKSEDWGEKYGTTALLALFCVNVETGKIGAVKNVPGSSLLNNPKSMDGGYVLGQPVFSPCGKCIVYTGWDAGGGGEMPRRLGAIYCFHRPCKIYSSPVSKLLSRLSVPEMSEKGQGEKTSDDGDCVCITPNDRLARSPRFSNPTTEKEAKMAYLCNTKGFDTHGGCMALRVCDWDTSNGTVMKGTETDVVDLVALPGERPNDTAEVAGIKFPGLFLNQLPDGCFSPDGKYISATTEWGSVTRAIVISLADGSVLPINFNLLDSDNSANFSSQRFICFTEDGGAVVAQSEVNRPTLLGYLPSSFLDAKTSVVKSKLLANLSPLSSTSSSSVGALPKFEPGIDYVYKVFNILPNHGDVKVPVGCVLMVPENSENAKLPMIVVPHGGPHTCMSTSFFPSYGFLCKHGRYAILHVNFRGSTGFGQASLESLAGNAGSLDVLDVVSATQSVIDMGIADPDRIGVCGGSHGGFLAGHLIGQNPGLFKVAAMRNPCTNIASMVTATDIPDWCYVETLGSGIYNFSKFRPPSKDELNIMWEKSPIAHIEHAKAPTLIALGMKDRRVPPSQGLEYFHALRAKNVPSKLLIYEDCDHALDKVVNEADFWINTKRWFDDHLRKK
mmetsp:Transcript_20005/g.41316  ORF Transcript_20005/g.41316 Transcript_20005/m.41316 type:complete len:860 (-) Transcript_20005:54-2633(-)